MTFDPDQSPSDAETERVPSSSGFIASCTRSSKAVNPAPPKKQTFTTAKTGTGQTSVSRRAALLSTDRGEKADLNFIGRGFSTFGIGPTKPPLNLDYTQNGWRFLLFAGERESALATSICPLRFSLNGAPTPPGVSRFVLQRCRGTHRSRSPKHVERPSAGN